MAVSVAVLRLAGLYVRVVVGLSWERMRVVGMRGTNPGLGRRPTVV